MYTLIKSINKSNDDLSYGFYIYMLPKYVFLKIIEIYTLFSHVLMI